ncbi:TerD family protein [Actinacidiphila alni]|uniref:TerD family protein n=1 Tax=Actinacidiphila alni TaxID=380248 RepID=UPI0033C797EA
MRRQTTSVHLQDFPQAHPPLVEDPPQLGLPWARSEARSFHLSGIGILARADRTAAKQAADADAPAYLASETARLRALQEQMLTEAEDWWRALVANDETTVCEAVNFAFSDNPASGCAVGVDGATLSVVIRQPDIDSLPDRTPSFTPTGRQTLKALTKRERTLWWLTSMGSNIIATLKEGFATAPGITAIDLAVLTRMPDTMRLGFVAYGRWTRRAIEAGPWREPQDALRFLDIGQDVSCSVTTTASGNMSSTIKPLDTSRLPGLQSLLEHLQDDGGPSASPMADLDDDLRANALDREGETAQDPYQPRAFADWKREAAPQRSTAAVAALPPAPEPVAMAPGQTVPLPEQAWEGLLVAFTFAGADADLTLFLTDANGRVGSDDDFVFYNQPSAAQGAARLLGKRKEGWTTVERATVHLAALPANVHRVAIAINMDIDTGLTCGSLRSAVLHLNCANGAAWTFQPPPDPNIRAMSVAELYRHQINGQPGWKLRAIGQGWSDGLDGLACAHGVDVD